jgi:hypothetical protein
MYTIARGITSFKKEQNLSIDNVDYSALAKANRLQNLIESITSRISILNLTSNTTQFHQVVKVIK